jgi:integrase
MQSIDSAKAFCKKHKLKGLDIRSASSIRALIRFNGKLYRIPIIDVDITDSGLFKASEKVSEYKNLAKYNFAQFEQLTSNKKNEQDKCLGEYIEYFLNSKRYKLASCTYKNYLKKITKHISPKFETCAVSKITPVVIEKWVTVELYYLGDKTIKELLCLLSQIFAIAMLDETIKTNPVDSLKSSKTIQLRASLSLPDPFSVDDMVSIASTESKFVSEKNMILFNCVAGLRLSELMALSWEDVDFEKNVIYVQRAVVERDYKTPKTASSVRSVDLLPKAREVLLQQLELREPPTSEVSVTQPDNRSQKVQEIRFVFFDSRNGTALSHDNQFRNTTYKKIIIDSGVRWRGINQTRHTYASHLISAGLPLAWVSRQMGHNSIKMIEKHYSKWLPTNNEALLQLAAKAF